jgi:hypothetical protein
MSKAFVFLNCDAGAEKEIVSEMSSMSGVLQAAKVSGIYDIVAEVNAESESGIAKIVRKLRAISKIRSCLTMVVAEKKARAS